MMRSTPPAGKPEFKSVVDNLMKPVSNYDRVDCRSAIREPLVVPVTVVFAKDDSEMPGFTRNISTTGVGLLLPEVFKEGSLAAIDLERADGKGSYRVLAESRWIKSFGASWFLSGWKFIKVEYHS